MIKFHYKIGRRAVYIPVDKISSCTTKVSVSGDCTEIIVGNMRHEVIEDIDYVKEQCAMASMSRLTRKIYRWLKKVA